MAKKKAETVAIVLVENVWDDFKKNPEFASAEPFFKGLAKYNDSARCYRLNFFDESSFKKALTLAETVAERRVIIHIGAHAEDGKICGVPARRLMSHLSSIGRKIEGVILSCCSAGNDQASIEKAFEGNIRWLFSYRVDVDWMGSTLIDTCILEEACLEKDDSYLADAQAVAGSFAEGLTKFNPDWPIDDDHPNKPLKEAVALWVKPHRATKPTDVTGALVSAAWPDQSAKQPRKPSRK